IMLGSREHIMGVKTEPINRQRIYIIILTTLQVSLIKAFSSIEIIIFYIIFETTLIPTLILITH
uniref:NADH dehydrogenase subunit 4 n=1 Tax=Callorhinchus milii TaxID=7868 RepID=A0A4W3JI25_CALMI